MTKARDISKLLSTANGKIAGANLDVSFENISDSGTAGTKVASGTTGQRGSTAGQIRFNTTTGLAEYYTGTDFKVIDTPPTVTAVSPLLVDLSTGGNITFAITGSNFQSGAVAKFVGNDATEITASTTTVTNSTTISAVIARSSFVNAKEPYDIKVSNSSGLSGILDNQVYVDTNVAWSTASGSLGTLAYNASGTHYTLSATDADSDTITYSVLSGTLPTGLSLNSSTGVISGTLNNAGGISVSTFTIRASTTNANADRQFSITVGGAPYSVDFLVVAGGGSGGYAPPSQHTGGGGGAGGFRTSTQTVSSGTAITITVGDGGAGGADSNNGSNSSISGSGLTTITSTGGGRGGRADGSNGQNGGSGGGGASGNGNGGGSGNTPSTSPSQGNNGGNGFIDGILYDAGGGGGAGSSGVNGTTNIGGNGGNGASSSITGTAINYAGGGGGGARRADGGTSYIGYGIDGGGNGGAEVGFGGRSGGNATANTGSGGGGNHSYGGDAGSGGKGVVILSVPTASYSGTTTGSPTVTTKNAGADTVLTFTGSGSYTG
jgi:hypothetical protein